MRQIEPPLPGQVFAGTGGMRKVVSVKKRSNRMNDYNIEWQRPDNDWRSTVMWLPYWARWAAKAKQVSSNVELSCPEAASSPEGPALTQSYASRLRKPLDVEQRALLERQLQRDDLQIFTVVRMAQKDIAKGDYDMALSRLRMDADKLRDEKELYVIIRYYFD